MGSKAKKRTAARKNKAGARRKGQSKSKPTATKSATDRFVNDLLTRGEAAKLDPNGKLPLEATHVIDSDGDGETPKVRRLRYKLF